MRRPRASPSRHISATAFEALIMKVEIVGGAHTMLDAWAYTRPIDRHAPFAHRQIAYEHGVSATQFSLSVAMKARLRDSLST
jgi:hypothetical protein